MIYDAGHWACGGSRAFSAVAEIVSSGDDIDLMVLSHTDSDHLGAVKRICDAYRVKRIIRPGLVRDTNT